jgi:hypothetical protein
MPFGIDDFLMVQTAGNIFSGLAGAFGPDSPRLPEYLKKMLLSAYNDRNFTGYLPDKQAYDQTMRTEVDEIMAGIPIQSEAFEADLASRGIRGAGEAPGYKASQVYAPVTRAATTVVARSQLGYAQAHQQGMIAHERMRQNYLSMLMQYEGTNLDLEYRDFMADTAGLAEFWGSIGEMGALYGIENWDSIKKFLGMGDDEGGPD